MDSKKKKIVNRIITICFIVIILELGIMAVLKISRERNIDRIKSLNDLVKISDGYVGVGVSDFHQSKFVEEKSYQYTESVSHEKQNIITTQSRIVKMDNNMNMLWENTYPSTFDSSFNSVIEVEDGYVAVGYFANEYKQIENNIRDAMIVKYDKDGKILWSKTYQVLSDTKFYKVIEDDGDYIVIGQSIYENLQMGTHTIGGGIIVRYNKDGEELAHNNYGGNKSGLFNDIIKTDDGYIVCGRDASNYGIVLKFSKDFNRDEDDTNLISKKVLWQRTYSNTDADGFKKMIQVGNNIYAIGALNVSDEKDSEGNPIYKYDAGLVIYNTSGKYFGKSILGEKVHHRFNSGVSDGKYLYLSLQLDVDSYRNSEVRKSIVVKYDIEKEKYVDRIPYDKKNSFVINQILDINNQYMIIGTENNQCGIRGCDYSDLHEYLEQIKN